MMRFGLLGLTLSVVTLAASTAIADPVTFRVEQYGCELRVDGKPAGRIEPNVPKTIDLRRGHESLVECESHDIPVKLYARNYVFPRGNYQNSPLPSDVRVVPVAVLPNVVRAAAVNDIQVTAIADSTSVACKLEKQDPKNPMAGESHQVASPKLHRITKGSLVQLTGTPQLHCGDTNLIEVMVDGSKDWFRNRDFTFSYKGKPIMLFPVSQDLACCWIE